MDLPNRVIYDLDGAIDDCLALFVLLFAEKSGLVKIEALTTAPGSTAQDNVIKNVYRILEEANRTDIPVYRGSNATFFDPKFPDQLSYGKDAFGDVAWKSQPNTSALNSKPAAFAMGELVTKNPGKISIIGTTPPTNIVMAAKLFDSFMADVKVIHLMGGNYNGLGSITPYAEWNYYVDAEGAAMLLNLAANAGKTIRMVTTEAIQATNIDLDWRKNVLGAINNKVLNIIRQAENTIYPKVFPKYLPADAYGPATFIIPDMITKYEIFAASVDRCECCITRGKVNINFRNNTIPNGYFIEAVDQEKFKSLLLNATKATV